MEDICSSGRARGMHASLSNFHQKLKIVAVMRRFSKAIISKNSSKWNKHLWAIMGDKPFSTINLKGVSTDY